MADATPDGEKSVIKEKETAQGVQIRTNTRLREKYFIDERKIVTSLQKMSFRGEHRYAKIIKGAQKQIKSKPITIRCATTQMVGDIQVDVIRDGQKITAIRISCPCGRHTELSCEYNP